MKIPGWILIAGAVGGAYLLLRPRAVVQPSGAGMAGHAAVNTPWGALASIFGQGGAGSNVLQNTLQEPYQGGQGYQGDAGSYITEEIIVDSGSQGGGEQPTFSGWY